MPNIVEKNYLEDPYLSGPEGYLGGEVYHGISSQVNRRIDTTHHFKESIARNINAMHPANSQVLGEINKLHKDHEQISRQIIKNLHLDHEQSTITVGSSDQARTEILRQIDLFAGVHSQTNMILQHIDHVNAQVDQRVDSSHSFKSEIQREIDSHDHAKSQIKAKVDGKLHEAHSSATLTVAAKDIAHSQIKSKVGHLHAIHGQINRDIQGLDHTAFEQISRGIAKLHGIKEEVLRDVTLSHHDKEQTLRHINLVHQDLEQVQKRVTATHKIHDEIGLMIGAHRHAGEQTSRFLINRDHTHSQIERITVSKKKKHTNIRRGNVLFLTGSVYLESGYLEDSYLVKGYGAHVRSKTDRRIAHTHTDHEQVSRKINTKHKVHSEIERRINAVHKIAEQINRLYAISTHSQVTQVLYNTTNLRILLDFPSRGSTGTNWSANSTLAGDFSVNNLNTDIVEQVWRSNTGVKTGISLICDTQVSQGVFVDTLAMLNTNLTTSASILWEASNNPGFSSISFSQVLVSTKTNIYYIAPTLPSTAYRYHRFTIEDNTNTASSLQIGTIVFGSSIIFQGECFVDQVTRQTVHFSDKIATEAFTNVSNDRALKFSIGLDFKNLEFNKGNYSRIRDVFETARTSLKCLWIPTPKYASRYAVFAKLQTIPVETHNDYGENQDYVDFAIQVDESL